MIRCLITLSFFSQHKAIIFFFITRKQPNLISAGEMAIGIGQKIISNGDIIKLAAEIRLLSDEKSILKNGHYKIGQFENVC